MKQIQLIPSNTQCRLLCALYFTALYHAFKLIYCPISCFQADLFTHIHHYINFTHTQICLHVIVLFVMA